MQARTRRSAKEVDADRAERRRAARRGRPKGSTVPLSEDPDRFEIAAYHTLKVLGLAKHAAGHVVTALLHSTAPVDVGSVEGVVVRFTTGTTTTTLHGRAGWLVRKAERLDALQDEERFWLMRSSAALYRLIAASYIGNAPDAADASWELDTLGWREIRARVAARILGATSSNFPPSATPLGRAARRLVDAVKAGTEPPQ